MKLTVNNAIKRIKTLAEERPAAPLFFMTVGLPGSGKSTFLRKLVEELGEEIVIASTDDIIEAKAAAMGLTYSEGFNKFNFKQVQAEFKVLIAEAIKAGKNIAIDQTNVGSKARRSKSDLIPKFYIKTCLVFDVPGDVLLERLNKRAAETGKIIPALVVKNMTNSWQTPTKDDGFEYIIEVLQ